MKVNGTIEPLDDRVVIVPDEDEKCFAGSRIIKPDTVQEESYSGTVLALGPGKLCQTDGGEFVRRLPVLKKGDRVLFSKYAGLAVEVGERKCKLMREDEVFARIV